MSSVAVVCGQGLEEVGTNLKCLGWAGDAGRGRGCREGDAGRGKGCGGCAADAKPGYQAMGMCISMDRKTEPCNAF